MHPLGEPDIIEVIENRPNEGVNENGPNEGVNEGGPIEGVKENGPNEGVHVVEATEEFCIILIVIRPAGDQFYEVRHISATGDKFSVSLRTKECSCRRWMLTGLPCRHAISCMRYMDMDPGQYVPNYFRRETYEACYHPIIYPTNGQNLWVKTRFTDLQPPPIKRQPGRPKKKRNKEARELKRDDKQLKRAFHGIVCGRCKQPGHNKSTCKQPPAQPPAQPASATQPASASQPAATQAASASQPAATQPSASQAASASQPTRATQAPSASQPVTATQTPSASQPVHASQAASASQPHASKKRKKGQSKLASTQPPITRNTRQKLPCKSGNQSSTQPAPKI
jgi:pyruvate/2-oxoglutarate dehydrogenase complex dihydrolipoamide acyltransferase (E2) component